MPKGLSIHIGLNSVNPSQYGGWSGDLLACESDARDMEAIAAGAGFQPTVLLTPDATSDQVLDAISSASGSLGSGDMLLVSYSGHGGQVPDTNADEDDLLDETWVLFDREVLDDELYTLWGQFSEGVRILVLSDSCHSGTVAKVRRYQTEMFRETRTRGRGAGQPAARIKAVPPVVQQAHYEQFAEAYRAIESRNPMGRRSEIGASVLLISGCQDHELSWDGPQNGLFTGTLLEVWSSGAFQGSYVDFHDAIRSRIPASKHQTPNLLYVGATGTGFEQQRPFSL